MDSQTIQTQIEQGKTTCDAIAAALDVTPGYLNRELKRLANDPSNTIQRRNKQGTYEYFIGDESHHVVADPALSSQAMPVNREYNWDEWVPQNVDEFVSSDGTKEEIMAEIEHRHRHPKFLIAGHTGTGKTLLALNIAHELEAPFIAIQAKYAMDESDLTGSPMLVGGETWFVDGPLNHALLASQERDVVVLIDEANRAETRSKSPLFSFLDDRAEVQIGARGGEVIRGNPDNLIVLATVNEGREYHTERMDIAERRRFANKYYLDYLGMENPEKEIELIMDRTDAPHALAFIVVKVANSIRKVAADKRNRIITRGVPTSMLINWVNTARSYDTAGLNDPLLRAANAAIIRPFYGENDDQQSTVSHIFRTDIGGIEHPFDEEWLHTWFETDVTDYTTIRPENIDQTIPDNIDSTLL